MSEEDKKVSTALEQAIANDKEVTIVRGSSKESKEE